MSLTLVTGPAQEPLTLEQAKAQLRLDVDTDDALIIDFIKTARQWGEGQIKRALITQTHDLNIDYNWPWKFGSPRIDFPINPVSSVTSITYVDLDGTSPQPTLAASQYTVVARRHGSYIVPAYNINWPSVRSVPNAITVRFVAGDTLANLPKQLERAVSLLVAHMYENRETVTAKDLVEVPYAIESLISPFRPGGVA
jgi:uncharacterized phiE125 gp8 family phage protein